VADDAQAVQLEVTNDASHQAGLILRGVVVAVDGSFVTAQPARGEPNDGIPSGEQPPVVFRLSPGAHTVTTYAAARPRTIACAYCDINEELKPEHCSRVTNEFRVDVPATRGSERAHIHIHIESDGREQAAIEPSCVMMITP
jgi:hypothetical protein